MQETASFHNHCHEYDPLAMLLVGLPMPAYFAAGALFATGVNRQMARSPCWHKIWWFPQVTSMAGNLAGYSYTGSRSTRA